MSRHYTTLLLDMMDDGLLRAEDIVIMCVKAMSEEDVEWMMNANELMEEIDEEDE